MDKLLKTINNCAEADDLLFSLSKKILDAKREITPSEYNILCEAYYKKGLKLGLDKKNNFNNDQNYLFIQDLYKLGIF